MKIFNTNPETTQASSDAIGQNINTLLTVSDVTRLRIFQPNVALSSINYVEGMNYRKKINQEYLEGLGRGMEESGQQMPIGLVLRHVDADTLNTASNNGTLDTLLTNNELNIIFGNCRYHAATNHTNMKSLESFIYPSEAWPYYQQIQFIENSDREDPVLVDSCIQLYKIITNQYAGNVAGFSRFSGEKERILLSQYRIGEAAIAHETFYTFIDGIESKDYTSLETIARSFLDATSNTRQKNIASAINSFINNGSEVKNLRDKARQLKSYSIGKSNKLPDNDENKKSTQPENPKKIKKHSRKTKKPFDGSIQKLKEALTNCNGDSEQFDSHEFALLQEIQDLLSRLQNAPIEEKSYD